VTVAKKRILVVDDELGILKLLRARLEGGGYEVLAAMDGAEALRTMEAELPDLLILDIMMPGINGIEVCRRIREWSQVPIIMLSARGDENDKVKCLDTGADDYIIKPFGAKELIARVQAVLRRNEKPARLAGQPEFTAGELLINFSRHRVAVAGEEIKLTPIEYKLLQELALNAGKVLTYSHLLNKVWGQGYRDEKEYLHVYISHLRAKLERDVNDPLYIKTMSGVGYMLQTPD